MAEGVQTYKNHVRYLPAFHFFVIPVLFLNVLNDVRYLVRYLNLTTAAEAMTVVTRYFDDAQIPLKTRLALEELLPR